MRDAAASDFCYYPFFQVLISAEGKYKVCSKHYDHITHEGKVLTTQNATIKEAWESEYMQEIRKSFLENKRFPGCAECWRMQKMGLRSMRYHSYQYGIPESQVQNPAAPMRIETNSSNVCNLRCRICFATASTKWLQEAIDLYDYKEEVHINMHTENLAQVKEWAPNLVELALFGGEPLLSDENFELLDYLIDTGHAGHISLLFNTNGTVFDRSVTDRLRQFKKIRMSFSIDDLGERFEFQRKGAEWSKVVANMRTAHDMLLELGRDRFDCKICISVSILNVYYLPELFEYFQREFPEFILYFNYIYDPSRFNVQILPDSIKSILNDRLRSIPINPAWHGKDGELMEEFLPYLNNATDMPFGEFFRLINRHDIYRKESYPDIFPEWWALIGSYCPADVHMGEAEVPFRERTDNWIDSTAFTEQFQSAYEAVSASERTAGLEKAALNSLAMVSLFEERKQRTEKIHIPELYRCMMDKLDRMNGSGSDASDTERDPGHAKWVKTYLVQSRDLANLTAASPLNGPLNDNIDWVAEHADSSSRPDKLINDLLSTPAAQLAGDLSRTSTDRLQQIFLERYT